MQLCGAHPIGGLFEGCLGSSDAAPLLALFQAQGFRVVQEATLEASASRALYGVSSGARCWRLRHGTSDHGLIRIFQWERSSGPGLGQAPLRVRGSRWLTFLARDLSEILNHAEEAQRRGDDFQVVPPTWDVIYNKEKPLRPFVEPLVGVREMALLHPEIREIFFQRFNYSMPLYGSIAPESLLGTSQATHMGLVVQDDGRESFRFYDEVLGLLRARDGTQTTWESGMSARRLFGLVPGEWLMVTAFDSPDSSASELQKMRSGRLYFVRFPESVRLEDFRERSRPGCLGLSHYTFRVHDADDYHRRVKGAVSEVTPVLRNEFGERSFSFVGPEGGHWNIVELPELP